jgi:secondary thiamine-phosphate synthase enzyme
VKKLTLQTERKTQLLDVTARVREVVSNEAGQAVVLFVPHTTAGVVLQASGEGAALVTADLETAFERIVDEGWPWRHVGEGDRNPWSHARSALTASSVTIPLDDGEPALGEFQTIFFCEFDGPRSRQLYVTVI